MSFLRPVLVVAGLGTGGGTGAATVRLFVKEGYSVALIARQPDELKKLEDEINGAGGTAASFPIQSYSAPEITNAFAAIRSRFPAPEYALRAALYNAWHGVWKPFFEVTQQDLAGSIQTNIEGSYAFAREVISSFNANDIDKVSGKRGALIFTGATASIRGNTTTSSFSPGKHAVRALSQSLAKEFGKENIHVSHVIIDGATMTNLSKERRRNPEWEQNADVRLDPNDIAKAYLYLAHQERSAWTWELDLRPAHEKW